MNPQIAVNMKDAGKLCGLSRWAIQGFIRQGLPYIPTGGRNKLIMVSVLEQWLKSRQTTARGAK